MVDYDALNELPRPGNPRYQTIECRRNRAYEAAQSNGEWAGVRDELWFQCREWLEDMSCWIPKDGELTSEITGVRYEIRSSGKIKVESKEEMKKRSSRSPDLADALMLTFARQGRFARVPAGAPKRANSSYNPIRWMRDRVVARWSLYRRRKLRKWAAGLA